MSLHMEEDDETVISFGSKLLVTELGLFAQHYLFLAWIDNANELHPVAEILDNLKNDDLALRLGALRRLTTIALALGPERTTNDLLPFLTSLAGDEEDEVLLVLGEELPKLIPYGTDGARSAHHLLPVLEVLLQAEETIVRQQAVTSTLKVMETISEASGLQGIEAHAWPMWLRLSQGDFFISKASAASLAADVYAGTSGAVRADLRRAFASSVCLDDCPIVRRAAVPALSRLIPLCSGEGSNGAAENELWPLFESLANDGQDSVRLLVPDVALAFGDVWPANLIEGKLLPVLLRLAGDRSWRVRYVVAASFPGIMERIVGAVVKEGGSGSGMSKQRSSTEMTSSLGFDPLTLFTALLTDAEAEVRTSAARQLAATCAFFSQADFERQMLPVLRGLATDRSVPVRAALALQLNPLSAIAGADLAASALFPLYTHFFADESSQVRLNTVAKMDVVCRVLGLERLAQSILPAIIHLAEDKQWRVREAVIEHLPTLTSHLGDVFFDEHLAAICLALLEDAVFAVRVAAAANIRALCERFSVPWAKERLLAPAMSRLTTSPNYLRRMGCPRLIVTLLPVLQPSEPISGEIVMNLFISALKALATDPIANVRLSVARAAAALVPFLAGCPGIDSGCIASTLQLLQQDSDADVQFYAGKALLLC